MGTTGSSEMDPKVLILNSRPFNQLNKPLELKEGSLSQVLQHYWNRALGCIIFILVISRESHISFCGVIRFDRVCSNTGRLLPLKNGTMLYHVPGHNESIIDWRVQQQTHSLNCCHFPLKQLTWQQAQKDCIYFAFEQDITKGSLLACQSPQNRDVCFSLCSCFWCCIVLYCDNHK